MPLSSTITEILAYLLEYIYELRANITADNLKPAHNSKYSFTNNNSFRMTFFRY